jgi:hypothetical protein
MGETDAEDLLLQTTPGGTPASAHARSQQLTVALSSNPRDSSCALSSTRVSVVARSCALAAAHGCSLQFHARICFRSGRAHSCRSSAHARKFRARLHQPRVNITARAAARGRTENGAGCSKIPSGHSTPSNGGREKGKGPPKRAPPMMELNASTSKLFTFAAFMIDSRHSRLPHMALVKIIPAAGKKRVEGVYATICSGSSSGVRVRLASLGSRKRRCISDPDQLPVGVTGFAARPVTVVSGLASTRSETHLWLPRTRFRDRDRW